VECPDTASERPVRVLRVGDQMLTRVKCNSTASQRRPTAELGTLVVRTATAPVLSSAHALGQRCRTTPSVPLRTLRGAPPCAPDRPLARSDRPSECFLRLCLCLCRCVCVVCWRAAPDVVRQFCCCGITLRSRRERGHCLLLICGRLVAGLWLTCGRLVADLWLACGRPVVGLWLGRGAEARCQLL